MSPFQGRRQQGVKTQKSPFRARSALPLATERTQESFVIFTKIFAKGGFPPEQIKPRPFEPKEQREESRARSGFPESRLRSSITQKGRGLEKRLKPLIMGLELCSLATAGTHEGGVGVVETPHRRWGQGLGGRPPIIKKREKALFKAFSLSIWNGV